VRILVVTSDAFGGQGGIALYNRDLLTALCHYPRCAEVVAFPRVMPKPPEPLPAGLTYVTGGLHNKLKYLWQIVRFVRGNAAYDLVICGHINLLPVARFLRWKLRAPLVLIIYGIEAWRPGRRWLSNILVSGVNDVVSGSRLTRNRFLQWAQLKGVTGHILPNAIHPQWYGPGPRNSELLARYGLKGKRVLMTLGRIVSTERYKGFDEIIELLPALRASIPDIAYLVVGDGSDRERLEAKCRDLGVEDRVVFTGEIPEHEKADHYRLADAYVMPSRGEGFGFVILEALACGIPVLASRLDGGQEAVLDGQLGVLVDPENKEELANGIVEVLNRLRGVVPSGLAVFSFANFERRLHATLQSIMVQH